MTQRRAQAQFACSNASFASAKERPFAPKSESGSAAPSPARRRAQAATEYLIILSVVIIIAIIVIGAVGGFPGLTSGVSERESAAYWANADLGIIRYSLVTTGSASSSTLVLRNNRNFQIQILNVSFDGGNTNSTGFSAVSIAPGGTLPANFSANILNCSSSSGGAGYSKNVVIYYKDEQYGNTYTLIGEKPLVGTCQPGEPATPTPAPTPTPGAWVSPSGYTTSTGWGGNYMVFDGSLETYGYAQWEGAWNERDGMAAISCSKVRIYPASTVNNGQIELYYNGGWHTIYSGSITAEAWTEYSLGGTYSVTSARITWVSPASGSCDVREFQFFDPAG